MPEQTTQYTLFRDTLTQHLISRQNIDTDTDVSELDEFIDFLASESWNTLPSSLQNATYSTRSSVPEIEDEIEVYIQQNTSSLFIETLISYGILEDEDDVYRFLKKVLEEYKNEAVAKPPPWSSTKKTTNECEICEREVPLTYHHLIPKSTHGKAFVRDLDEWRLNAVAWLCRPCHSMVHRVEPNDVLAQEYYTVELLLEREDIQKWRKYASKQRWSTRPPKVTHVPV